MKARTIVKAVCWTAAGFIGLVVLLIAIGLTLVSTRVIGKDSAPRSADLARDRTADALPIPQLENHTCGLLSLSAAYKVFGLSPEDKNLRFRLGVDVAAQPLDSTSTGTLHPDLFRVLLQDGFAYELIDPSPNGALDHLLKHLGDREVALTLIRRPESGGLHWVLIDSVSVEGLRVVDSLKPEPTNESAGAFLRECVLSLVVIRPAGAEASGNLARANREGLDEMRRVRARLAALPPRAAPDPPAGTTAGGQP